MQKEIITIQFRGDSPERKHTEHIGYFKNYRFRERITQEIIDAVKKSCDINFEPEPKFEKSGRGTDYKGTRKTILLNSIKEAKTNDQNNIDSYKKIEQQIREKFANTTKDKNQ